MPPALQAGGHFIFGNIKGKSIGMIHQGSDSSGCKKNQYPYHRTLRVGVRHDQDTAGSLF
jgi:hypothetical protein